MALANRASEGSARGARAHVSVDPGYPLRPASAGAALSLSAAARVLRAAALALGLAATAAAQDRPWLETPYAERPQVDSKEKAQEVLRLVTAALKSVEARPADSPTREALLEALRKQERVLKDLRKF